MEKLTSCGIKQLHEILKSEQDKNGELNQKLEKMVIPQEVQGIHTTQDEITTLSAILKLRETQWNQVESILETQKKKQRGKSII